MDGYILFWLCGSPAHMPGCFLILYHVLPLFQHLLTALLLMTNIPAVMCSYSLKISQGFIDRHRGGSSQVRREGDVATSLFPGRKCSAHPPGGHRNDQCLQLKY